MFKFKDNTLDNKIFENLTVSKGLFNRNDNNWEGDISLFDKMISYNLIDIYSYHLCDITYKNLISYIYDNSSSDLNLYSFIENNDESNYISDKIDAYNYFKSNYSYVNISSCKEGLFYVPEINLLVVNENQSFESLFHLITNNKSYIIGIVARYFDYNLFKFRIAIRLIYAQPFFDYIYTSDKEAFSITKNIDEFLLKQSLLNMYNKLDKNSLIKSPYSIDMKSNI